MRARRRQRMLVAAIVLAVAGAAGAASILLDGERNLPAPARQPAPRSDARPPASAEDPGEGLWLAPPELAGLPTHGEAWEALVEHADARLREESDLARRDDHNVVTLAAALVGERLDSDEYREKAIRGLETVIATPPGDDLLAASRRLSTYTIAADVLQLAERDPDLDGRFRAWLEAMRDHSFEERRFGSTIVDVAEHRPNNWGTHAGASRIAVAIYLDDQVDLASQARVFRGYLGDRRAYARFQYGDLDWQADPAHPVGVNPVGTTIQGQSVDGVLPDDQRRGGGFRWPPPRENYVWEALQGAVVQAQLLHREGYDAWNWEEQALLRAVVWLHDEADYPAEGDDTWIPWLINHAYGTELPAETSRPGKNMGFTDWTHATAAEGRGHLSVDRANDLPTFDQPEEGSTSRATDTQPAGHP